MMHRTQIYLPAAQMVKLKEIAQCNDTTISQIIRVLLQQGLAPKKKQVHRKNTSLIEIARRVNATGEKGPRDLAKNMDRYLYGEI